MKNSTTLLLSLLLASPAVAQQSITASWMPVQGTIYKIQNADSTGINHGASGQNVSWNFNALTEVGPEIMQEFADPAGKPGASSYPNATLAVNMENEDGVTGWHYFETNAYQLNLLGFSTSNGDMVYTDLLTTMLFPINPGGTAVNETFTGLLDDGSNKVKRQGTYSIISDGFGTLTLPNATFNSVHKMKAVKTYTDSVFLANVFVTVNHTTVTRYFWITNNVKQILMNVEYIDSDVTGEDKRVYFYDGPNTQGIVDNETMNLQVYPNPASNELFLSLDALTGDRFNASVSDITGSTVMSSVVDRQDPVMHLAGLSKGIYVLKVSDSQGQVAIAKVIVD